MDDKAFAQSDDNNETSSGVDSSSINATHSEGGAAAEAVAATDAAKTTGETASDELISQFLAFTGSVDPARASSYLEMSGNDLETAVGLYMEHQTSGGGMMMNNGFGGGVEVGAPVASSPVSSFSRAVSTSTSSARNARGGGGGGGGGGTGRPSSVLGDGDVRAPDETRRMRLMDFDDDGIASSSSTSVAASMLGIMGGAGGGLATHHGGDDISQMMRAFGRGGVDDDMTEGFDAREVVNRAAALAAAAAAASPAAAADESALGDLIAGEEKTSQEEKVGDIDDNYNMYGEDAVLIGSAPRSSSRRIASTGSTGSSTGPTLSDMFAPPTNLMHRAGGFRGARSVARDARRWLLVNLQRDSEFSCHALNRDVWRDELVENLVREGFIFWQAMDVSPDGQTYAQRYNVQAYPHVAIIDPRTGRLMWRKEGWTQVNPMTAEMFAEQAADFCSRHSFDKPPQEPRHSSVRNGARSSEARPAKRPVRELTEEEQLQAAIRASMKQDGDDDSDDDEIMEIDDDDEVEVIIAEESDDVDAAGDDNDMVCLDGTAVTTGQVGKSEEVKEDEEKKKKAPSLVEQLVSMDVGDEPAGGSDAARVQIRMPDGKRLVRKFRGSDSVRVIYAFVAQSNDEAMHGKEFELKAGFPPADLFPEIDNTIQSCGLSGGAITVRWK